MRHVPVYLGFAAFVAASRAGAESPPPPDRPRQALIADLGQHVVGAGYQRTLAPWMSAQLVAALYSPWTQNSNFLGLSGEANKGGDVVGGILRGRAFFYLTDDAPTGLWLSPFAQGGLARGTRDGARESGTVWAVGASVGYTALLGPVLLGGGGGIQYHTAHFPGGDGPPSFSRFYPHLDIQLGYAF